jgi:hypothetical protein
MWMCRGEVTSPLQPPMLTDATLPHALADLTARDPRLPREAVAGQIAAIDAIEQRALGL